jgi:hypothetical protein
MELFKTSRKGGPGEQDPSILKLQKERSSLAASMKSINDVIRLVCFYILCSIISSNAMRVVVI